jgi:hypothetical protein
MYSRLPVTSGNSMLQHLNRNTNLYFLDGKTILKLKAFVENSLVNTFWGIQNFAS